MDQRLNERFFEQIEGYDQLVLDYCVQPTTEEKTNGLLVGRIRVNGVLYGESYTVDVRELVKSASVSGEFYIFTCGCGVPQCTGLDEGIVVIHYPQSLRWLIPFPMEVGQLSSEERGKKGQRRIYRECWFKKDEYVAAITAGLEQATRLLEATTPQPELCPYGMEIEALQRLNEALKKGQP